MKPLTSLEEAATGRQPPAADREVGDEHLGEVGATGELVGHPLGEEVEDDLLLGAVLVEEAEPTVELRLDALAEPGAKAVSVWSQPIEEPETLTRCTSRGPLGTFCAVPPCR